MPKIDRTDVRKRQPMIGGTHPAEDPRRAMISKGQFLVGGSHLPAHVKRAPLPPDLVEFQSAAAEADRLAGIGYQEIQARLDQARAKLDELRALVRRR